MKIVFSLKKLHSASSTRGIGVYTRELMGALQKKYEVGIIANLSFKATYGRVCHI